MIQRSTFGTMPDGKEVYLYKIENNNGVSVEVITRGATLQSFNCPDRDGNFADILLGYDDLEGHLANPGYLGQTVGQYANRIAGGKFVLNGEEINVTKNEKGVTSLHGGGEYSHALWTPIIVDDNALEMSYRSPDGAEGFPGNVDVTVRFVLTDHNELEIHYEAVSDRDTIINFTNHAYFNLSGPENGSIEDHEIMINADFFTPTDALSIPTGEIKSVEGTPFDFREFKKIGKEIDADDVQLTQCGGYDHNFVLNGEPRAFKLAAKVRDEKSGRKLECHTDLPGMQFYTGNFLKGWEGKGGVKLEKRAGFCLETQFFPDTPNQPTFPQCTVKAGEKFTTVTVYKV